jgi:hypothetical protein
MGRGAQSGIGGIGPRREKALDEISAASPDYSWRGVKMLVSVD